MAQGIPNKTFPPFSAAFSTFLTDPIVVWREAFPTRRYHDPSGDAPVLGYSEPVDARWFLLIVGHKKMLLTALLEAGGCSQWAEGPCISPNPFYVEQAKSCLQQLESIDVPGSCELALNQVDIALVDPLYLLYTGFSLSKCLLKCILGVGIVVTIHIVLLFLKQ